MRTPAFQAFILSVAGAASADVPVQFLSPNLSGTGQATVVSAIDGHEVFVNGFNGLAFSNGNTVDPDEPRIFYQSRLGTTGGGLGGMPPARVTSSASVQTTAGLLEALNISGSVFSNGGTSTILPDERGSVSGGATVSLAFQVTEPVYAQWTGGTDTALRRNGTALTLNPSSIILLTPGSYEASASTSGFAFAPPGELCGFSVSNGFSLHIGNNVPAPAGVVLVGLAALRASRRRR